MATRSSVIRSLLMSGKQSHSDTFWDGGFGISSKLSCGKGSSRWLLLIGFFSGEAKTESLQLTPNDRIGQQFSESQDCRSLASFFGSDEVRNVPRPGGKTPDSACSATHWMAMPQSARPWAAAAPPRHGACLRQLRNPGGVGRRAAGRSVSVCRCPWFRFTIRQLGSSRRA